MGCLIYLYQNIKFYFLIKDGVQTHYFPIDFSEKSANIPIKY